MYDAWVLWCWEYGHRSGAAHVFGRNLHAAVAELRTTGKGRSRSYCGVSLSAEGEKSYELAKTARESGKRRGDPE